MSLNSLTIMQWKQWVNFIVGLWIILSGYIAFGPAANATNLTIAGIIVAALALWSALENRSFSHNRDYEHRHSHA